MPPYGDLSMLAVAMHAQQVEGGLQMKFVVFGWQLGKHTRGTKFHFTFFNACIICRSHSDSLLLCHQYPRKCSTICH